MNPKIKDAVKQQLTELYARDGNRRRVFPTSIPLGFDYADTLSKLEKIYGQKVLLNLLNYQTRKSLDDIKKRRVIPNHIIGECLYSIYLDTFGENPPMLRIQKYGFDEVEQGASEEWKAYLNSLRRKPKAVR
jgi:hypothetical protein